MGDVTRTVLRRAADSAATGDAIAGTGTTPLGAPAPDTADEDLARMLVLMWSFITRRRLRPGARPEELSAEELIEFWADDLEPASGRHARHAAPVEAAA